jgi:hypothetical protein
MGWCDRHDHWFLLPDEDGIVKVGVPVDSGNGDDVQAGWDIRIDEYYESLGATSTYEYDHRDFWQHEVFLENVSWWEPEVKYPRCICGKGGCPPERCGGPAKYIELREILRNPKDKEYQERVDWMRRAKKETGKMPFDEINPGAVRFSNPRTRLKHRLATPLHPISELPRPEGSRPRITPSSMYGGTHDLTRVDPTIAPFL